MTERDESPLAEHVAPRVDDARLARQWDAVSKRIDTPQRTWPLFAIFGGSLAVAAAAIVYAVVLPSRQPHPLAMDVVTHTIALPEGSQVTIEDKAAVSVERAEAKDVHLALSDGAIDLDVTHQEGRSFVVTAGGHDVIVVGTQFRVAKTADTLTVQVTRGLVRVEGPTGTHMIGAGQTWSTALGAAPPPPPEPSASVASEPEPAPEIDASAPAPVEPSARELLARATEARAAGHDREAAAAFDTLRHRYRSDPRAGLAAFELGRIRLDTLRDPAGAAEAFGDAIQLSPHATFAEDAEARRVEALEAAGKTAACEQARDAYAKHYPSGLHARQVAQRCNGR